MIYRFRTRDCPDADGRIPRHGEQKWRLEFPLEDGGRLELEVGQAGMESLAEILKDQGMLDRNAKVF